MYKEIDFEKYNYQTPNTIQMHNGNRWFDHYYTHLMNLAFQMYEWKNLPDSVSPKFLEKMIHTTGYVGFTSHKDYGFIAVQGGEVGLDIYNNPLQFQYANPVISGKFNVYTYADLKPTENPGVVIYNNDLKMSTIYSIRLFAQELAKTHEIMNVNLNAQKTPVIIKSTDKNLFSSKQTYNQFEGNVPALVVNEDFDEDNITAINTQAPYVVDKVNQHRLEIYNSALTFLGINNVNTGKKERLISDEANSNNDMVNNSGSIGLKSRREACKLINDLFSLNIEVDYRNKDMMTTIKGGEDSVDL